MDGSSLRRDAETGSRVCDHASLGLRERSGGDAFVHPAYVPKILSRLWIDEASHGLDRRNPVMSALRGFSPIQAWSLALGSIALLICLALAPSLVHGGVQLGFGTVFTVLIVLRIAACLLPPRWAPRHKLSEAALPHVSIIIPLYREAAILPALMGGLMRIDYPTDRLEIKLAIETDDHATLDAARALAPDGRFQIIPVPAGKPRTKPRALNYALRFCRGQIITILDAEDRPHPRQMRVAAESFAAAGPDLACLQAPLNWYNREHNWLTRQFALEYAAHFQALLPLYRRLGWPLPLGGTSNHFRAEALREVGGWDAWNVTEDADLGFRFNRLGYRCDVIRPMTLEEAPVRTWPWICQRTRWLKGYAQTLSVHLRPGQDHFTTDEAGASGTIRPGNGHLIGLLLTLGTALLSALLHAPLAAWCLYSVLAGPQNTIEMWLAPVYLSAGYLAAAACAATGMRRAGLRFRVLDLMTMPFYWPLQTLAAIRAIWQLLSNPFYWDKTEHGLSTDPASTCIYPSPRLSSPSAPVSPSSCSVAGDPDSPCDPKKVRASSPGP
jgi:cellulose synthase/poly-beta-1,6-N-acetylglucosamine synthase-like glycosyltransferase